MPSLSVAAELHSDHAENNERPTGTPSSLKTISGKFIEVESPLLCQHECARRWGISDSNSSRSFSDSAQLHPQLVSPTARPVPGEPPIRGEPGWEPAESPNNYRSAALSAPFPRKSPSLRGRIVQQGNLGQSVSLWMATTASPIKCMLVEDAHADVCIVGAGIAGIATAYRVT